MSWNGTAWTDMAALSPTSNFGVRALTGLTLGTLATGQQYTPYSQKVVASDGTGPYSYASSRGALPPGLMLASDGTLSGTPTQAGNYTFSVSATDSTPQGNGGPFQGGRDYTMQIIASGSKQAQTLTFGSVPTSMFVNPNSATFPNLNLALTATASSGLPVTFGSSTPLVCAVNGSTVTGLTVGSCQITADQAGDATWNPAVQLSTTLSVAKQAQTITVTAPTSVGVGSAVAVTATSSSSLPVTITATPLTTCSVSGSAATGYSVTGLLAGTCTVAANQIGDGAWNAATPVSKAVTVAALKAQTITLTVPATLTMGTNGAVTASSTSKLAVTVVSTTPATCTVNAGALVPVGAGTCSLSASQAGDATWAAAPTLSKSITVAQKAQTLTLTTPTSLTMGTAGAASAKSTSLLPVTISVSTPAACSFDAATGVLNPVGAGTCTVTAAQAGDATWKVATAVSKNITVAQKTQTITFTTPTTITRPATGSATATASSTLPVSVVSTTPTICTVSLGATASIITGVAAGTCKLTASQPGDATWKAATAVAKSVTIK
jgi:hypothetical protein